MTPVCGIYALADPDTGRIVYIGQSIDIKKRYSRHLSTVGIANRRLCPWMLALRERGVRPKLLILCECARSELNDKECFHIEAAKAVGEAEFNISVGGKSRRRIYATGRKK